MIFILTTASGGRIHEPSRYRALVREMKSEKARSPRKLLGEALKLQDSYYASLALLSLSSDARLSLPEAYEIARDAIHRARNVERLWRRAELLIELARKLAAWRTHEATEKREQLMDMLLEAVVAMPNGKELSDAIAGCVPRLGCRRMFPLLKRAVSNEGFEATGTKALIRYAVKECGSPGVVDGIMEVLATLHDPMKKSKLLGYLHLHLRKAGYSSDDSTTPLHAAIAEALSMGDAAKQREAFRYLSTIAAAEDMPVLKRAVAKIRNPGAKAKAMVSLAGNADKRGLREMAVEIFMEALAIADDAASPRERVVIRMNAAQGLARCGRRELAHRAYLRALDDCNEHRLRKRICQSMEEQGLKPPDNHAMPPCTPPHDERMGDGATPRHILALYNTYEGNLSPVHLRAAARAAPLCIAFGMDLALMAFPVDDYEKLMAYVVKDTTIGKGGTYLKELARQGRLMMLSPDDADQWDMLGMPVATTSHPDEERKITMAQALARAAAQHPLRRVCIIMGLGKRGLPASVLKKIPHHLELTGRNVSLETCTAMGVIAQQMHEAQKRLEKENE